MKIIGLGFKVLLGMVLAATGLLLWAAGGPLGGTFQGRIVASDDAPPMATPVTTVTVMTWNIAYGYGKGSGGSNYQPKPHSEYDMRLRRMAKIIRDTNADVVLLQEIDFDADRSHNIDQLQFLAEHTKMPYMAYAPSWSANHVPFPYWPPSRHFGKVRSGGAVLSRYPILRNQVILYSKPDAQPWWYSVFYLNRYSQFVQLDVGGRTLWVGNNHLEAFDRENRMKQAEALADTIVNWQEEDTLLLFGGDFNATPVSAQKKHGFADYPEDDYREDRTHQRLTSLPGFSELVSDTAYARAETHYGTFPAHAPERRLDYLVINKAYQVTWFEIIQTGELSDHLPVVAKIDLANPGPSSSAPDPSGDR